MVHGRVGLAGVSAAVVVWTTAAVAVKGAASPDRTASYALAFHGVAASYHDPAMFVLPDSRVSIDAVGGPAGDYVMSTEEGIAEQLGPRRWRWTAPGRPGIATLRFAGPARSGDRDAIDLRAFVMTPASALKRGVLNGYRIGDYPPPPSGNLLYRPPSGFIEVTRDNENTKLSPHFTLKQFVCKEDTSKAFPKYVVVQERLLLALETLVERVNALGFKADALHVMSAYRTPYYNHAIGDVKYSMHQFGGAADVYVDGLEAGVLHDEIARLMAADPLRLQGGLGLYPATEAHPPFVHVDVRGKAARWHG
jgi:Bacterial protein of unknown function (DUF882)